MRLGVISDTHGTVPSRVFEVFEKVDHILHAGDVGDVGILSDLGALASLTAVFGNMDGSDLRERCQKVVETEFDGLITVLTHGDQFGLPTPAVLHEAFPRADVIVFGHTHRPILELVDKTVTVMNPGSAGAPRHGQLPSVGIMEFEPGLPPRARLVPLD